MENIFKYAFVVCNGLFCITSNICNRALDDFLKLENIRIASFPYSPKTEYIDTSTCCSFVHSVWLPSPECTFIIIYHPLGNCVRMFRFVWMWIYNRRHCHAPYIAKDNNGDRVERLQYTFWRTYPYSLNLVGSFWMHVSSMIGIQQVRRHHSRSHVLQRNSRRRTIFIC